MEDQVPFQLASEVSIPSNMLHSVCVYLGQSKKHVYFLEVSLVQAAQEKYLGNYSWNKSTHYSLSS